MSKEKININTNIDSAPPLRDCLDNLRQAIIQVVTHDDIPPESKWFLTDLVKEIIVRVERGEGGLEGRSLTVDNLTVSSLNDVIQDLQRGSDGQIKAMD
ncbi:MAG: hypothetical protein ACK562_08575 [Acidobacteriota bacterium]|jgi:hypothetical protein